MISTFFYPSFFSPPPLLSLLLTLRGSDSQNSAIRVPIPREQAIIRLTNTRSKRDLDFENVPLFLLAASLDICTESNALLRLPVFSVHRPNPPGTRPTKMFCTSRKPSKERLKEMIKAALEISCSLWGMASLYGHRDMYCTRESPEGSQQLAIRFHRLVNRTGSPQNDQTAS